MKFLIDHNIQGQAQLLLRAIINQGWLDLLEIRFVTFEDMAFASIAWSKLCFMLRITWEQDEFSFREALLN